MSFVQILFTAYAHVRTEPQSDIGQTRGKKTEVPPQRIIDLDNATRQLHQLSCILDGCTITASYEVSQAQKALLLLPRTEKGSSTSSEEHYANLPELTHKDVLQEH